MGVVGLSENNMNRDMLNKVEFKKEPLHAHLIRLAEMCPVRVASKILSA